jgi:hypothetical protein
MSIAWLGMPELRVSRALLHCYEATMNTSKSSKPLAAQTDSKLWAKMMQTLRRNLSSNPVLAEKQKRLLDVLDKRRKDRLTIDRIGTQKKLHRKMRPGRG